MYHTTPITIIAVDPGYERIGIAVMEKGSAGKEIVLHSECFTTSSKKPFTERLHEIGSRFSALIADHKPSILAIENLFMQNNQKTAMRVAEVRGALIYLAKHAGLEIHEFTPKEIKLAVTGNGSAHKSDIAFMIPKLIAVSLDKKIDDEIDALAVGITCFAYKKTVSTYPQKNT
ncbi:MAG: crossover junction endodeoxyribonuclease RuvC [Candidatus Pacebacteria bacterium]|nr:crossover junction endodeoxyribonuclease RuvC [Candidatus Paceibacterota bacterium]MCD8508232.1 crossover junction endodeoxyribonuclease RuvC [Candidatus Paceibacterota bacterium]MCD8528016.1 crossover junction endodeoxyribonuclease RuvC [Candidatus Paceibacterota bacterium]MCD8563904.1 crossover junction endodeoxyribonuclease RuvC [Candidatus Paceibacterota bacterium]